MARITGASEVITYKGITIKGAYISGELDLEYAKIPFPIRFIDCNFPTGINLKYGELLYKVHLRKPNCNGLTADGLEVGHSVFMNKAFKSEGQVILTGSKIDVDLNCEKGHFINPYGIALSADGLKVEHSVFMNNEFESKGQVILTGSRIDGDLNCENGQFTNPNDIDPNKKIALSADGLKVGHSVFMNNGFKSEGKVNLAASEIGIALKCGGGKFNNPNGTALNANGIMVKRSIYTDRGVTMDKDFQAEGRVSLIDATIYGVLNCEGGTFNNPNRTALIGNGLKIERSISMKRSSFRGEVNLVDATIGGNLNCEKGHFSNPNGIALDAKGLEVERCIEMKDSSFSGEVNLVDAKIGGDLNCQEVEFINPGGIALNAMGLEVNDNIITIGGISSSNSSKDCLEKVNNISQDKVNINGDVILLWRYSE